MPRAAITELGGDCPGLVLAAQAATALIADDANGGNSGVAIVGRASLAAGGGLIIITLFNFFLF